jgi:hypothetical protein
MNTQTHMIMGAVLFGRKLPRHAWAGVAGGIIPDIPMYAIFSALKLYGIPDFIIFSVAYFDWRWQTVNAIGHSLIMWPLLALIGWFLASRTNAAWPKVIGIIAASATIHSIIDMLCHREDAHMHFWPLTNWKFMSPVSYWNPMYYGQYFLAFEIILGLAMTAILFNLYRHWAIRLLLVLAVVMYLGPPLYFSMA